MYKKWGWDRANIMGKAFSHNDEFLVLIRTKVSYKKLFLKVRQIKSSRARHYLPCGVCPTDIECTNRPFI